MRSIYLTDRHTPQCALFAPPPSLVIWALSKRTSSSISPTYVKCFDTHLTNWAHTAHNWRPDQTKHRAPDSDGNAVTGKIGAGAGTKPSQHSVPRRAVQ